MIKPVRGSLPNFSHPRYQGTIAHFLFNENTGKKVHDLARGRIGPIVSLADISGDGPEWSGGDRGSLLWMHDRNGYFGTNTSLNLANAPAVTALYRLNVVGNFLDPSFNAVLTDYTGPATAYIDAELIPVGGGYTFRMYYGSAGGESSIEVPGLTLNQIHTFVTTYGPLNGLRIYIDGILMASGAYPGLFSATPSNVAMSSGIFNGKYDEIRFWDRELLANEVLSLEYAPYVEFA